MAVNVSDPKLGGHKRGETRLKEFCHRDHTYGIHDRGVLLLYLPIMNTGIGLLLYSVLSDMLRGVVDDGFKSC